MLLFVCARGAGPYESAECILHVYGLCGSLLRHADVAVSELERPVGSEANGNLNGTVCADGTLCERCEDNHPGRDTTWLDETTGELCECYNGVAECGPHRDWGIYLTALEAGIVAGAGVIIAVVGLTFCYYLRLKHQKAMETPIEGGQRRSIVMPSRNDYVKSRTRRLALTPLTHP